jgi:hypothetical protein
MMDAQLKAITLGMNYMPSIKWRGKFLPARFILEVRVEGAFYSVWTERVFRSHLDISRLTYNVRELIADQRPEHVFVHEQMSARGTKYYTLDNTSARQWSETVYHNIPRAKKSVKPKDTDLEIEEDVIELLHPDAAECSILDLDNDSGKTSTPSVWFPERLNFLKEYCRHVIIGFSKTGVKYHVFVFDDLGYAVAESEYTNNATYVFRMIDGWREQIDSTKKSVRSKPCFVRRVIHTEDWEYVLLDTLTQPA